jgi:mannose-6-phosphate isomerase class I
MVGLLVSDFAGGKSPPKSPANKIAICWLIAHTSTVSKWVNNGHGKPTLFAFRHGLAKSKAVIIIVQFISIS